VSGAGGSLDLISVCGTALGSPPSGAVGQALSSDGQIVYFTARGPCPKGSGVNSVKSLTVNELFARIDADQPTASTVAVAGSECGAGAQPAEQECRNAEAHPASPFMEGASADGTRAVFASTQKLTDDASEDNTPGDTAGSGTCHATVGPNGCNLYLFDLARPAGERLIDISAGDRSGRGPEVQGVLDVSPDGSHVYFVARGVLTGAANKMGASPTEGADNLYVYEQDSAHPAGRTAFIATLPGSQAGRREEAAEWGGNPTANVTNDGNILVFTSRGALTPDTASGAPQVFRYDDESEELRRISIGQRGFNNNGNAESAEAVIVLPEASLGTPRLDPTMSADGSYVFFSSSIGLTPTALNNVSVNGNPSSLAENVYEWEANGERACKQPEGCVFLISDGLDASGSNGGDTNSTPSGVELLGTDQSGEDVFFATADPLLRGDGDSQLDFYDARIGGGFAEPSPEGCPHDERCSGQASESPVLGALGSALPNGLGNLTFTPVVPVTLTNAHKPPTRAQKLAKALRRCHARRNRARRIRCERDARHKYGRRGPAQKKHAGSGRRANTMQHGTRPR
jgi:Tol biopolymer transport system component